MHGQYAWDLPKNSKTIQLQRILKNARGSDRQRLGLKGYVLTTKTCSLPKVPVQRCRLEQRSVQNSTGPVHLLKQFWTLEHQLSAQNKSQAPAATKHSWVQNSASTLRKYSNPYSQLQIIAIKYLSTYSNKKFEYVIKFFEIFLYLSQVYTEAIKMAAPRRQLWRRRRQLLNNPVISRRVIRDRINHFPLENYSKDDIFDRFRFRPQTIHFIMDKFAPTLAHNTTKNCALPPVLQLLTRFSDGGIPPPCLRQYWGIWNNHEKMLSCGRWCHCA